MTGLHQSVCISKVHDRHQDEICVQSDAAGTFPPLAR